MPGPPLSQAIVRYKGPSKADNKPMRIVSAFVNSRRGGVLMKESICRLLAILSRRNYCLPSESGSIMIFALGWMAGKLIFSSQFSLPGPNPGQSWRQLLMGIRLASGAAESAQNHPFGPNCLGQKGKTGEVRRRLVAHSIWSRGFMALGQRVGPQQFRAILQFRQHEVLHRLLETPRTLPAQLFFRLVRVAA